MKQQVTLCTRENLLKEGRSDTETHKWKSEKTRARESEKIVEKDCNVEREDTAN